MAAAPTTAIEGQTTARERVGELFDRHRRRLFYLALRMTGERETALDLVQEAFLRVARRPNAVPRDEPAGEAWLVRVVVNLCRDRSRRRAVRRRSQPVLRADTVECPSPETAAVAHATIWRALTALPARRRAIVVLTELEELPVERVAKLVGVRPATVRWHLSVARRELAAAIRIADAAEEESDPPSTGSTA